ncbi:F0F1 ATP synthase subunit A [Halodesulfovibrio sp.]|jgi:F-type H+-transporting ATPase subunit a|uniref:F0F1 ATP synthase subunit A n=1 Tax=Halodesulfovibrio sp. TaxID=1912772 RepID=UPI0025E94421|nr:F0F1 ATP synthase subunit A [Halodesulfovibrio sp.]MCT4534631.1 F0F1 ATP synthase subunit A [Halodesulfovibrio sp.]MCT4628231.1 F0F1 ATP synthase subunit A [Halodesulfovibrio sp.]
MASGLPHPLLLAPLAGMDSITINGEVVNFSHVFYTWIAMAILFSLAFLVRGQIKIVPGKLQNVFETIIGGLEDFVVSNIGEDGRKIFHVLIALFLFIITMNLMGLIPGFDAPTANVNTNAAMALFTFGYYNWVGLKRWGAGYIKHFCGPFWWLSPLMLPLELISHCARPLSLTLRLFGNIRGEEIVLILFFLLAPIVGTIPIYFLFGLAKCLQAFIWFMLSMIYLKGALEHAH